MGGIQPPGLLVFSLAGQLSYHFAPHADSQEATWWGLTAYIKLNSFLSVGELDSTKVANLLLTQVWFFPFTRVLLLMLQRFIDGIASTSGQSLDNVNLTSLVLASCKLALQKNNFLPKLDTHFGASVCSSPSANYFVKDCLGWWIYSTGFRLFFSTKQRLSPLGYCASRLQINSLLRIRNIHFLVSSKRNFLTMLVVRLSSFRWKWMNERKNDSRTKNEWKWKWISKERYKKPSSIERAF